MFNKPKYGPTPIFSLDPYLHTSLCPRTINIKLGRSKKVASIFEGRYRKTMNFTWAHNTKFPVYVKEGKEDIHMSRISQKTVSTQRYYNCPE